MNFPHLKCRLVVHPKITDNCVCVRLFSFLKCFKSNKIKDKIKIYCKIFCYYRLYYYICNIIIKQ